MRRLTLPLTLVLFSTLFAAGLPASPAQASRNQVSVFQDDDALFYVSDSKRNKVLNQLRGLGVDVIRFNVVWNNHAKAPGHKRKPRSFHPSDPSEYRNMQLLDKIVRGAHKRGMEVLFTPTTPGPAWASQCKKAKVNRRRVCKPSPSQYATFVAALGKRYKSVHRWSLMNEPNLSAWLQPQWEKVGKHYIRRSPTLYRNLVRAATAALRRTGHGHDQILLGETGPFGRSGGKYSLRSIAPGDFYRELFCLNGSGRKLKGHAAKIRKCRNYKKLKVTGVAHHAYSRGAGSSPHARVTSSRDITLRYINRLFKLLDRGAKRGRVPRHLGVWITEYGFQTRPPDRFAGVSLRTAARWLNESDWLIYNRKRIKSVSQYLLRDERVLSAFQSGLRFRNGKAKPGLAAYRLPIWPIQRHKGTRIWLQVRPASTLGRPQKVTIQYRKKHSKKYRKLKTVTVRNRHGFAIVKTHKKAKLWRLSWKGNHSRAAAPAKG
jgi:Cellulase (glycosyl hydrolase family 5)